MISLCFFMPLAFGYDVILIIKIFCYLVTTFYSYSNIYILLQLVDFFIPPWKNKVNDIHFLLLIPLTSLQTFSPFFIFVLPFSLPLVSSLTQTVFLPFHPYFLPSSPLPSSPSFPPLISSHSFPSTFHPWPSTLPSVSWRTRIIPTPISPLFPSATLHPLAFSPSPFLTRFPPFSTGSFPLLLVCFPPFLPLRLTHLPHTFSTPLPIMIF